MRENNDKYLGLTIYENPISHIKWKDIEKRLNKKQFNNFKKWMSGQTMILEGVYPWDFERWVSQGMKTKQNVDDWD